jgi:hypothetical protein
MILHPKRGVKMRTWHECKTVHIEQDGDEYQIMFACKYQTYKYGEDRDGQNGEVRTELLDTEVVDAYKNGHIILATSIPKLVMLQAESEV